MREYLEKLLEEQKWEEAEAYAEQMLKSRESSPADLLACQLALLQSRSMLDQFDKALGPGLVAIQLAENLGEWDSYGLACIWLGTVHDRLGRSSNAVSAYLEYLARVNRYTAALQYESLAWYNLGLVQKTTLRTNEALASFRTALAIAEDKSEEWMAHVIRRALVEHYLQTGEISTVPRLLARSGCYLRHHPTDPTIQASHLYHIELRAKLAIRTRRLFRGQLLALRGLEEAGEDLFHQHSFHMVLADIARKSGKSREALGHAAAASICASRAKRNDLETQATDLVYELLQTCPNGMEELDWYYLSVDS